MVIDLALELHRRAKESSSSRHSCPRQLNFFYSPWLGLYIYIYIYIYMCMYIYIYITC